MRPPSEKPSQHPSGGPWSEPASRRSARPRSRKPEPNGLTARQKLRIAGVVLGGALGVYAVAHALSDEPKWSRARTAQRRASVLVRSREAEEPLDGLEAPARSTPGDAGTVPSTGDPEEAFTLTWVSEAESSELGDAGLARTATEQSVPAPPPPPAVAPLPPAQLALGGVLAAAPVRGTAEPLPSEQAASDPAASDDPNPPMQRHFVQVFTSRWQQPGLCPVGSASATAARNAMLLHFRRLYWDNGASLFLDPRLSNSIAPHLVEQLEAAAATVHEQLQLDPARPNVFAYADERLMLAASCANNDVVAYYDGAIHLVPTHPDVAQSAVHEYTHHALMSSGLIGPAWAQEGIAMTVANETWWRQRGWLDRVADKPFSIESMEQAVPYTLSAEQAALFYVQAAAMVACALQGEEGGLVGLVQSLRRARGGALEYTLPSLADPRFFRACAKALMR